jgi:hypothetical protein
MSRCQLRRRDFIALIGGAAAVRRALLTRRRGPARSCASSARSRRVEASTRPHASSPPGCRRRGQQVVVENKTGASGNIAAEFVARSDPDGYTIYIATFPHAANRYLYSSLGYDPVADFAPVTLIGVYPLMMVVPNSSPAHAQLGVRFRGQTGKHHDEGYRTSYCRPAITLTTGRNSCAPR